MLHLNDTFPSRWVGCDSTINWPPRSPELTLLLFCLWVSMKSKVYRQKLDTEEELLDRIMYGIAYIKKHQYALRRATRHVLTLAAKYIDVDGEIFENVLY
jgi:hypothetical protein